MDDESLKKQITQIESMAKILEQVTEIVNETHKKEENFITLTDDELETLREFRNDLEKSLRKDLSVKNAIFFAVNDYLSRME